MLLAYLIAGRRCYTKHLFPPNISRVYTFSKIEGQSTEVAKVFFIFFSKSPDFVVAVLKMAEQLVKKILVIKNDHFFFLHGPCILNDFSDHMYEVLLMNSIFVNDVCQSI